MCAVCVYVSVCVKRGEEGGLNQNTSTQTTIHSFGDEWGGQVGAQRWDGARTSGFFSKQVGAGPCLGQAAQPARFQFSFYNEDSDSYSLQNLCF